MTIPDKFVQMDAQTRKKKITWKCTHGNNLHILDKIYNYKYYKEKIKGLQEIVSAVKDENFGIIVTDFRDHNEKSEHSENQWMCLYFSRIEGRVFCVPILEGNDFLQLQTIHLANSEFYDIYWQLHRERLKIPKE